jgi:hypothetical protein
MTGHPRGADSARVSAFVTLANGRCSTSPRGERGMPGARRTRGLVCKIVRRDRTRAYRFSGGTPAFPARWPYGLCRAPRRRIRLVTVVNGLMACLSPVGPACLRGLGASNGRQDHTVLPYATPRFARRLRRAWYPSGEILAKAETAPFVLRAVARSRKPPCEQTRAPTLSRPPRPIPRS